MEKKYICYRPDEKKKISIEERNFQKLAKVEKVFKLPSHQVLFLISQYDKYEDGYRVILTPDKGFRSGKNEVFFLRLLVLEDAYFSGDSYYPTSVYTNQCCAEKLFSLIQSAVENQKEFLHFFHMSSESLFEE